MKVVSKNAIGENFRYYHFCIALNLSGIKLDATWKSFQNFWKIKKIYGKCYRNVCVCRVMEGLISFFFIGIISFFMWNMGLFI